MRAVAPFRWPFPPRRGAPPQACRKISLEALEAWGKRAYRPRGTAPRGSDCPSLAPELDGKRDMKLMGSAIRPHGFGLNLIAAAGPGGRARITAATGVSPIAGPGRRSAADAAAPRAEVAHPGRSGYRPRSGQSRALPVPTAGSISSRSTPRSANTPTVSTIHPDLVITVISLFVLGPAALHHDALPPRRQSGALQDQPQHRMIEVIWTLVPVLILVASRFPRSAAGAQYEPPPARRAHGQGHRLPVVLGLPVSRQWRFEVVSNMLRSRRRRERRRADPGQLEVDNRMVVPAGEPAAPQTTAPT
jgi:cytochrome c oxidase subunit II